MIFELCSRILAAFEHFCLTKHPLGIPPSSGVSSVGDNESAFSLNGTQCCATSWFGIIHFQPSAFGITEERKCELNYGEFHLDWLNQNVRRIWFRRLWQKCFKAIWKHIDELSCWINSHFPGRKAQQRMLYASENKRFDQGLDSWWLLAFQNWIEAHMSNRSSSGNLRSLEKCLKWFRWGKWRKLYEAVWVQNQIDCITISANSDAFHWGFQLNFNQNPDVNPGQKRLILQLAVRSDWKLIDEAIQSVIT